MKVAMIDYGRGNLRSVERALEKAGAKVSRVESASEIDQASLVVLPGVITDWPIERKAEA